MNRLEKKPDLVLRQWTRTFWEIRRVLNRNKSSQKRLDFRTLGCLINLKLHLLHSHLHKFPDNVGDLSKEQGELFYQDIKIMETRYKERWDETMMADFWWRLKKYTEKYDGKRKRKPLHR